MEEKNELLNLLAWSGSAPMGASLAAAVLDKKKDQLEAALKEKLTDDIRAQRQKEFPLGDNGEWVDGACTKLGDWFDARRKDVSMAKAYAAELTHLEAWTKHAEAHAPAHLARLTWLQAYPPFRNDEYKESLEKVREAMAILEKAAKPDEILKAEMSYDMGAIYGEMDNYEDSLTFYRQALDLKTVTLGEQHAETADVMDNVAGTLDRLGKQAEGLELMERALEIRKQLFGEKHEDTASSYNNIGTTYFESSKYREAIDYLRKAFELRSDVLGAEDKDTVDSLYNLCVSLINLKQFKAAYDLLADFMKKIPPGHPQYMELAGLVRYIDKESIKSGFRAPSAARGGSGKKKKKKKKKR